MPPPFHVYLMTNRPHGTLYIGATHDLVRRVWEHRTHVAPGFADRYNLERLLHLEGFTSAEDMIRRETALRRWRRAWKVALIEEANPGWRDLWADLTGTVADRHREILGSSPRMTPRP